MAVFTFNWIRRYYNAECSRNVILTEINDWEITMSKKSLPKGVTNGQLLICLRTNGADNNGH